LAIGAAKQNAQQVDINLLRLEEISSLDNTVLHTIDLQAGMWMFVARKA
jgi:hypothetical protein